MNGTVRIRSQRGLLASVVLLAAAGCAEHGAMPTRPQSGQAGDWRQIYPSVTSNHLSAAWGLDADDMWAVGTRGAIVHWDGQQARAFASDTAEDLMAIDGRARDDAWAVSWRGGILRWDGRRWRTVDRLDAYLNSVCCVSADEVYVAGQDREPLQLRSAIWRREEGAWVAMRFAEEPEPWGIRRVWQPGPGQPPVAAAWSGLYRYDGEVWRRTANLEGFHDATADLVIAADPSDQFGRPGLFRLREDGGLHMECAAFYVNYATVIAVSRLPVLADHDVVRRLEDCYGTRVADVSFAVRDLAIPVLGDPHRAPIFAVGQHGGFARLTWLPDQTMLGQDLIPPAENRSVRAVAGDGIDLYLLADGQRIYRRSTAGWQPQATPFPPEEIQSLGDGTVAIIRRGAPFRIAIGGEGGWQELPSVDLAARSWWIGDERRPRILVRDQHSTLHELWGLDGPQWHRVCVLDSSITTVSNFDGFAPDDLYVRAGWRLLHHDGERVTEVFPDQDINLWSAALRAGRHTRRLYFEAFEPGVGNFGGWLHEGELTLLPGTTGWVDVCEVAEDLVFCYTGQRIYQLVGGAWCAIADPVQPTHTGLWGHRDQGLFLVANQSEIFHRDLPRGDP